MRLHKFSLPLLLFFGLIACKSYVGLQSSFTEKAIYPIEPYQQDTTGDPVAGYAYLVYGDHIGNGIPIDIFSKYFPRVEDTVLKRKGENRTIPYGYNAFKRPQDSLLVVSGNCFSCHASKLNGKVVLGLGDAFSNFTKGANFTFKYLNWQVRRTYGKDSEVWEHYEEQAAWLRAIGKHVKLDNPGQNPAFLIEEACIAYRNQADMSYRPDPMYIPAKRNIGSDVPPLWNLDKKQVLYYNGMGRGDFPKLIMQVLTSGVHDSTHARHIHTRFKDVLAYLRALEPPPFPGEIDPSLAAEGEIVFLENCAECHGTYGDSVTYPNDIVAMPIIKTDSAYARYIMNSPLSDWANGSWEALSNPPAQGLPSFGYVAPPLDGVWATAPYLHNGSVPDLATLLESDKRPPFWQRSGRSDDYNLSTIGWNYTERQNGKGEWTYDTTLPGSGNMGHYFGDELTKRERKAVMEYLKTL